MSDICLSVISSPLGTPLTYWSIVSSSERSPLSAALSRSVAVKVLVTLPILWCTSGVIGTPEARSATPRARTHVYWAVCTAATTPGASLSLKDLSNAGSRSALDACSHFCCQSGAIPPTQASSLKVNCTDNSHREGWRRFLLSCQEKSSTQKHPDRGYGDCCEFNVCELPRTPSRRGSAWPHPNRARTASGVFLFL